MTTVTASLGAHLGARRADHKLLLPYVTAGITPEWVDLVHAVVEAGADAVEIGIPFSDPAIDGPTIQQASVVALDAGMTPKRALAELADHTFDVPLVAMTHYNLVARYGHDEFARDLVSAGGAGTILPDLPMEHAGEWRDAAERHGLENVLLVAPSTSDERLRRVVSESRGFIYVVSTMGTTGERAAVDDAAGRTSRRVKAVTDMPAIVGFGISNGETAVTASREADGVVVASALMRRVLEGRSVADAADLIGEIRAALDAAVH